MLPGAMPTFVPSGILIHPTVWPQYTNVTDRQENGPVAWGEQSVTCNGRPKSLVFIRVRARYMDISNGDVVESSKQKTPSHSA